MCEHGGRRPCDITSQQVFLFQVWQYAMVLHSFTFIRGYHYYNNYSFTIDSVYTPLIIDYRGAQLETPIVYIVRCGPRHGEIIFSTCNS